MDEPGAGDGARVDRLPDRLVGDLMDIYGHGGSVPPAVDHAILARARTRLAAPRRRRAGWIDVLATAAQRALGYGPSSLFGRSAGAAATVLLIIAICSGLDTRRPPDGSRDEISGAAEDVDGNGRVDIGDAFHLARALAGHTRLRDDWDVNRDGVVGREDVDAIALAAVRITGR
jgi:hypothetical protein